MNKAAKISVGAVALMGLFGWQGQLAADVPCYYLCDGPQTLRPTLGNAVRHNNALQVVDPDPPNSRAGAPNLEGNRAAKAYERYRTGRVREPARVSTGSGAK